MSMLMRRSRNSLLLVALVVLSLLSRHEGLFVPHQIAARFHVAPAAPFSRAQGAFSAPRYGIQKKRPGGLLLLPTVTMTSTETGSINVNLEENVEYRPDRDTESQAYESNQGWTLQYHDIKTRRDVADARAQVGAITMLHSTMLCCSV